MNRLSTKLVVTLFSLLLMSCSLEQSQYKNTSPNLELDKYFNGPITAWGMVKDYSNEVTRRFCVELTGTWHDDQGLLAETFYFDDGEVSYRNWQLTKGKNNSFTGTAEDVVGQASGQSEGFSFRWQYNLSLAINNTQYEFFLDDWLYQLDEYRLFNQTDMKKFGITVATLTIFFDKQLPLRRCDIALKN